MSCLALTLIVFPALPDTLLVRAPAPPTRTDHLGFPRDDCRGGPRPCPLVTCPYNNYLDVDRWGNLKLSHPGRSPEEVPPGESCALDVADQGPHTLEEVADILGLTRERVRQIEGIALRKIHFALAKEDPDLFDKE